MQPQDPDPDVTLYTRSDPPSPAEARVKSVRGRLRDLAADGAIGSLTVREWAKRVPADTADEPAADLYRRFEEWAGEVGVDLEPYFHTRSGYEPGTTHRGQWIVFPVMCLVVRREGDLTRVYPHSTGTTHRTVSDGIAAIGGGRLDGESTEELPAD